MQKISVIMIMIFILCFSIIGCQNRNNVVKKINAEYFTISYGKSLYKAKDRIEQDITDSLVENYNNIKLVGTTNQEINYDRAITIIFIDDDQISGKITIDDKGICRIDDNLENYIVSEVSSIYIDAINVYNDLKEKYES